MNGSDPTGNEASLIGAISGLSVGANPVSISAVPGTNIRAISIRGKLISHWPMSTYLDLLLPNWTAQQGEIAMLGCVGLVRLRLGLKTLFSPYPIGSFRPFLEVDGTRGFTKLTEARNWYFQCRAQGNHPLLYAVQTAVTVPNTSQAAPVPGVINATTSEINLSQLFVYNPMNFATMVFINDNQWIWEHVPGGGYSTQEIKTPDKLTVVRTASLPLGYAATYFMVSPSRNEKFIDNIPGVTDLPSDLASFPSGT